MRRLLRRGEIEIVDPGSGRPVPVVVELHAQVVRLVPMLESPKAEVAVADLPFDDEAARWAGLLARLRRAIAIGQAEELVAAVENELGCAGDIEPPV